MTENDDCFIIWVPWFSAINDYITLNHEHSVTYSHIVKNDGIDDYDDDDDDSNDPELLNQMTMLF